MTAGPEHAPGASGDGWRGIRAALILGVVLNLLGWLGNVFLLGGLWQDATVHLLDSPWRNSPWRDVISFLPDFIYAFAMVGIYRYLSATRGATFATALRAALIVFFAGVFTTYLGTANAGLLPWTISAWTTLLALVTFIPGAWLMQRLL